MPTGVVGLPRYPANGDHKQGDCLFQGRIGFTSFADLSEQMIMISISSATAEVCLADSFLKIFLESSEEISAWQISCRGPTRTYRGVWFGRSVGTSVVCSCVVGSCKRYAPHVWKIVPENFE